MSVEEYLKHREGRKKQVKNQEGYQDRTAADAIANAERIPKHIKEILYVLDKVAEMAKVEILTIEVRDKETKRMWRRAK